MAEKIEELKQYERELEIMAEYDKPDKVISSEEARQLAEEEAKKPSILTQVPQIDDMLGGFREGQLVVISGPTGHGKTTFCRNLTLWFEDQQVNSLWFSYEEGMGEFLNKFYRFPQFYTPQELVQGSLEWIEHRILESIAKYDCQVVFIDHLHYLLDMSKMAEAKSLSILIGMMLRELKKIAIKHRVTIFLVSHMKKLTYDRAPEVDDLRDSSFVGQEADIVMFIKRVRAEGQYTNNATLYISKNRRTGNLGVIDRFYLDGNEFKTNELNTYNSDEEMAGDSESTIEF